MTFTVFHHASIRVPGRLERPSAVGRLHRAGGGPFFFVVFVVVLWWWWSSSSSRWESSTNRSMSCVGIEVFLSLCRKAKREKVSALFLAGCEKGARKRARSVRDAQTIAFKPRAILFSVECAKKPLDRASRAPSVARFPETQSERLGDDAPLLKYTRCEKVLKSLWCRRFVFERSRVKCCLPSFPRRRFFYTESRGCCFRVPSSSRFRRSVVVGRAGVRARARFEFSVFWTRSSGRFVCRINKTLNSTSYFFKGKNTRVRKPTRGEGYSDAL